MKPIRNMTVAVLCGLLFAPVAFADDDEDEGMFSFFKRHKGVEVVNNKTYTENCGECHFAYQPGLLPRRSWEALMTPARLEDHFGENAELDEADRKEILAFLSKHAADDSSYKRSIKIRKSLKSGQTPLRISEVPYIRRKHHELGRREIEDNKDVRFAGNCSACHRKAAEGIYDEDSVRIPNFPDWDD